MQENASCSMICKAPTEIYVGICIAYSVVLPNRRHSNVMYLKPYNTLQYLPTLG